VILPDATIALHYMLVKWAGLIDKLLVYPEHMKENLERTNGLIFSQKLLLLLARAGLSREEAYRLVQDAAMETWRTGRPFEETVRARKEITGRLERSKLDSVFTLDSFVKEVDTVFGRLV
jgi:adenylosuccinate lyase